jgi:hypothetical protein
MAVQLVACPRGDRDWVSAAEWPSGWTHLTKTNMKEAGSEP